MCFSQFIPRYKHCTIQHSITTIKLHLEITFAFLSGENNYYQCINSGLIFQLCMSKVNKEYVDELVQSLNLQTFLFTQTWDDCLQVIKRGEKQNLKRWNNINFLPPCCAVNWPVVGKIFSCLQARYLLPEFTKTDFEKVNHLPNEIYVA